MDNRLVDKFLAHKPFADGLCERVERLAALYVEPVPDSPRARALGRLLQRMAVVDVRDRAAVANDMAAKAELAAKNVLQQKRARARTLSVDSVVCAHDGLDAALLHKCAERRKIRFIEIALRRRDVERVTLALGARVDGVVLRARGRLQVYRIVALKPLDELHAHARRQIRILAPRLHAAPPSWVAVDVHVGAPEREPRAICTVASCRLRRLVFDPRFVADCRGDLVDERRVERRGNADRLGEHGRPAISRYAMQCLVPPVVVAYAETRHGRAPVH